MTGFDQLSHATHTVFFAYFWLVMLCIKAVHLLSDLLRRPMVKRSRPHYVFTTIARTTAVPAILITMCDIIFDFADGDYPLVGFDVLVCMYMILSWFYSKDDDNWWKGRGRKLGRWATGRLRRLVVRGRQVRPA